MKKLTSVALFLCLSLSISYSQHSVYMPFSLNDAKSIAVKNLMSNEISDVKAVDVDFNIVNEIVLSKPDNIKIRIPFNKENFVVELKKFEILTQNALIAEGTTKGDIIKNYNESFVAYTSNLSDKHSPLVTVTFFKDDVAALILTEQETIALVKHRNSGNFILYRTSNIKVTSDFECRSDELGMHNKIEEIQNSISLDNSSNLSNTLLNTNIAIESDFEFYTFWGNSVERASSYIISLYVPVSAIYMRDANVRLQLGYIRVWSTSADPYPDATSSNVLLNSFRNYWNANMQSVPRTLAHFISTRPGGLGGIAWVNVLCASLVSGNGYAFSDIDGNYNQLPVYSWDVMVVAHETGHNFGSPHTHSCSWPGGPIDSCYTVEGNCYNGPQIPRVGTIMSYCHLNGSIALFFGPLPSQLIRSRAEIAACMNSLSGYQIAYPNGGSFYRSNTVIPVIWGTSNTGTVDLQYTSNNGNNWLDIAVNVDALLRTFNWQIPYIPTTSQAKVRVFQSGNVSTSDMSDSSFQIRPSINQFTLLQPEQLTRINVSNGDTTNVHFIFGRSGTLPEFKYKWIINTLNNSNIYSRFTNNSGSDTVLSVRRNLLDSLAASWGASNPGDSIRLRWTVKSYTVYDSLNANTNFIVTLLRTVIGIEPISTVIPDRYFVTPNYPNPFNPETKIKFGLPFNSNVRISVYDLLGREVDVLVNSKLDAGEYIANWNAANFASGIYLYRIETTDSKGGSFTETKRMVLVK